MNILVIEDNLTDSKLISLLLTSAGHGVRNAPAAEGAFAMARHEKPQLILLDLDLPGLDGLSVARTLKRDPELSPIPIVAVTAYPDRWRRAAALEAGCDAYVVKPIDTRTFAVEATEVATEKETSA